MSTQFSDESLMQRAVATADGVRGTTAPNPWVGAAVLGNDGNVYDGATQAPGSAHAERVALEAAGPSAQGATLYSTLEPCCHYGRTPPCTDLIINSGIRRVGYGVRDPDPNVSGRGLEMLSDAGIEVVEGVCSEEVKIQLEPYLHQRVTDKPWVVLKMAMTIDGRTAAADGSSQWITSQEARVDVHGLRARCDAVLVGAGTIRADNPSLTTRLVSGSDPQRIVLGEAPSAESLVHPCWEVSGDLENILRDLGDRGVVDLLVEGGPRVAAAFHENGLVDEYIFYLAPALMGGDDGAPVFQGLGSATMADIWRGRIQNLRQVGPDLRIDMRPQRGV